MTAYLIGYDLNRPHQDYQGLIDAIKGLSGTWWSYLDSTWIVAHPGPATAIRNALRPYIDANDRLLVVSLGREAAWAGFNENAGSWLLNNL
jgi:hypothetical protein